jgi:uncharacterized metal-binding protein YceD (DUF177 family)
MTAPEFSRPERLDAIGAGDRQVAVAADADERAALARRFRLPAVARLEGDFTLRREATGVRVRGRVTGAVTQACSVTGEPLPATADEVVDLLFVPQPTEGGDEIELGDDSIDVVFYDGGTIDLGETAAETLALALDPFPRGPNADAALRNAGVLSEGEAGPFGALAALLKKD